MSERHYGFNTLALHAGQHADATTGALAVPIFQTASYVFHSTQHAVNLFALKEPGYIYSRIMNPTVDAFERRVAALEGGVGALATSSGQAAITLALLNLAGAGDEIVSAASLYGGTYNLFHHTFVKLGIQVRFVDATDAENFRANINKRTKAVYAETLPNPQLSVLDVERVAAIAHESGVPLVLDNTVPSPYLWRPIEQGADVIIHSTTKYIGGHGTTIGGIIVDSGKFDWGASGRFPAFTEPDPSYHGVQYAKACGSAAFITKARVQLLRDLGACQAPFNAFLMLQGLETLGLRMERHVRNAEQVARFLSQDPRVTWVNYPGLLSHPCYKLAQRYMPQGAGAMVGFGIRGGREAGMRFIDGLRIFQHVANIGDAKSLAIHPASTTHQQLTPDEQLEAGVTDDYVRLSIGLEDSEDILWDLDQALAQAA